MVRNDLQRSKKIAQEEVTPRLHCRSSLDVRSVVLCCVSLLLCLFSSGCSRKFWRKQADADAYRAISQAETDGRWMSPRINIQPDPRSRFYDPYDPDCTPLPPDDPAAAQYMQCSDGIRGYKSWHKFGQTMSVENPQWMDQFEMTEVRDPETDAVTKSVPGIKKLDLTQAIELSYIHSRDYQTELENLYLAALDLSFQRFRFQVRYLTGGGGEPRASLDGTSVPDGQNSLGLNSSLGLSQLLPTGGQWAVELTNNTLWLFSGQNQTTSASILSYSLVQPLLAGAGRSVAMEGLTQTERNLLYATRDLARFRKQLFTETVSGRDSFLSLLSQVQSIRNQKGNIVRLERQVESLRVISKGQNVKLKSSLQSLPEQFEIPDSLKGALEYDRVRREISFRGPMSEQDAKKLLSLSNDRGYQRAIGELVQLFRGDTLTLDVAQLESSLRNSQNTLRSQKAGLQNSLDQYKIDLGLPPDLHVTLDDSLLNQFQLIDDKMTDLEKEVTDYVEMTGTLQGKDVNIEQIKRVLAGLLALQQKVVKEGLAIVEEDVKKVEKKFQRNAPVAQKESSQQNHSRTDSYKYFQRDQQVLNSVRTEIGSTEVDIRTLAKEIQAPGITPKAIKSKIRKIRLVWEKLVKLTQSLQVVQAGLRVELIAINKFTMSMDRAIGLAMENRLDLMNRRGIVMDARRAQEIAAKELQAVLNVVVDGDVRTDPNGNNPLDFRGSSSSFRVGVAITAPIDQVAERNAYRASQIAYQRAKRNYSLFEDNIKSRIRASWRDLDVLKRNLETARQALRFAAIQYDQAVEEATAPKGSGQGNQGGVQGRNLTNALQSILRAQDSLIGIWVNYESSRLNIYRDMGIMEIDERGLWVDDFYQSSIQKSSMEQSDSLEKLETFVVPPQPTQTPSPTFVLPHDERAKTQLVMMPLAKTTFEKKAVPVFNPVSKLKRSNTTQISHTSQYVKQQVKQNIKQTPTTRNNFSNSSTIRPWRDKHEPTSNRFSPATSPQHFTPQKPMREKLCAKREDQQTTALWRANSVIRDSLRGRDAALVQR